MRFYTVHAGQATRGGRELVLVKEGFSWPAALFSVLWALWHRLWWIALALLVVEVALEAVLAAAGAGMWQRVACGITLAVLIGLLANDGRRMALAGRGFDVLGVVGARDRTDAEQRLFDLRPDLLEDSRA